MSIYAYPENSNWKTMDTSEIVGCGKFVFPSSQQLAQAVVHIYIQGRVGAERIRARIYHDAALTIPGPIGDWFTLADIPGIGSDWRGRVGLTVNSKPWLQSGYSYYIAIESDGYTRNATTAFIAFLLDDFQPINIGGGTAIAVECYGFKEVSEYL